MVTGNVENVSRLRIKMNGDLILMVAVHRNTCSRPTNRRLDRRAKEKSGEKRNAWTVTACFGNTALVIPRWWLVESRDFLFDPSGNVGGNVFDFHLLP